MLLRTSLQGHNDGITLWDFVARRSMDPLIYPGGTFNLRGRFAVIRHDPSTGLIRYDSLYFERTLNTTLHPHAFFTNSLFSAIAPNPSMRQSML